MITEDYCSYDVSKLLKEKGFDLPNSPFNSQQEEAEWVQENSYTVPNLDYDETIPFDSPTLVITAPHVTHQMAMKWLREMHKIAITVSSDWEWIKDPMDPTNTKNTQLSAFAGWFYAIDLIEPHKILKESNNYTTYEETCEAAIKYCLENLI